MKCLAENGYKEDALAIACQGLTKDGNCQGSLAYWTVELAEELEDFDVALIAYIKAFNIHRNFDNLNKVKALSGDNWLNLKKDFLKQLRSDNSTYRQEEKVKIFLQEKLFSEVIALVDNTSYLLSYQVLDGVVTVNPEWVIKKAVPKAEEIMNNTKSQYYDTAIEWLKRVKKAYEQDDRINEWKSYHQQLMTTHIRKHKLICLLKKII